MHVNEKGEEEREGNKIETEWGHAEWGMGKIS